MATLKISREALHSTLKHFVGTGPVVFLTPNVRTPSNNTMGYVTFPPSLS